MKKEITDFYEKYGDEVPDELYKYNREKKFKAEIRKELNDLYRRNRILIRQGLKDTIKKSTDELIEDLIDIGEKPDIKSIRSEIKVTEIVNENIQGLNWVERQDYNKEHAVKKIQEVIIGGFDKGKRYEDMAKELSHELGISEFKSKRIIRTEAHRCHSVTRQQGYEAIHKSGIKIKKKWVSSKDERVRSTHSELDGQVVDIDKPFELRGYEAMYPGGFGVPELDINCRCTTEIVSD